MNRSISRFIDHAVLLMLLTLIPLRTVASETHTFETPRFLRGLTSPGPTPATTFAIAAMIVACAGWVFASRSLRGERAIRTGFEVGFVALIVAATLAFCRAGQKHLALIGAVDFLTIVLYAITLRQLLISRWSIRLALAVVMATAGMLVAKACYQKWVEWPATVKYYEDHRNELLGESSQASTQPGASLQPPSRPAPLQPPSLDRTALTEDASAQRRAGLIHDYEARLRSGAMTGYFAHPNILGSCMAMLTLCCAGIGFTRWRGGRRGAAIVPLILTIGCTGVLLGTQSKGAALACAMVAIPFAINIFGSIRPDLMSPRVTKPLPPTLARRLVITGWVMAAIGAVSLFAMLRAEPGTFGLSMRYRAMYWEGAKAMVDDVGWWGIGPDNFGRHFTRYKPVACPEEVDDPHNWLIKSTVEYGWLGAAGLLALLIGGSLRLASPSYTPNPSPSEGEGRDEGPTATSRGNSRAPGVSPLSSRQPETDCAHALRPELGQSVVFNLSIVLILFGGFWLVLIGGQPLDFSIVTLALGLTPFALLFVAGAIERVDSTAFDDTDLHLLAAGLGAGLVAFMAHTFIDLAMFTPGAATMFFAIAAIALAARGTDSPDRPIDFALLRARRQSIAIALFAAMVAILLAATSFKTALAASFLQWGRRDGSVIGYGKARATYTFDSTAVEEHLEALAPRIATLADADEILEITNALERRDPFNAAVWHHRMTAYYARFAIGHDLADLRAAVDMQRHSVETYPTSPLRWLALADLLERLAGATGAKEDRLDAAAALERALKLDGQRIYVSAPNRLSDSLKSTIQARADALRAAR